jgi:hypothetical protein
MAKKNNSKKKDKKKKVKIAKKTKKIEISKENKILRNFLLILLGVFLLTFLIFFLINSNKTFEYKGVPFEKMKMGKLVLYHTTLPVYYQGTKTTYNFYLRNDPRALKRTIPFDGEFIINGGVVFNATSEFGCQGYGAIATENLKQLYKVSGVTLLSSEGAQCDSEGRYVYIEINSANSTYVRQTNETCYEIGVKNCEILPAMERFMIEALAKINDMLNN